MRSREPVMAGGAAGQTRILLAEKLPKVRDAIRAMLEGPGLGADVIEAQSLADALSLASDGVDLDIMVVGQTLRGMNGVDGVAAIKRVLPDLPVAVLSDACRRADVLAAFAHGAHAYIDTRKSAKVLIHALQLVLAGEKFVPWAAISGGRHNAPAQQGNELRASPRRLSRRERQVLALLKKGMSNGDIATSLGLKRSTIYTYLGALYSKLGVANRGQLTACDGDDPACPATPAGGAPGNARAPALSARDQTVIAMLEKRSSNREIAERLGVPLSTLKYNLGRLYAKLGAANRAQAVNIAARLHGPTTSANPREGNEHAP